MRSRTVLFRGPAVGVAAVALAASASASASVPPPSNLFSNGPIITNPTGGTGTIAGLPISNADGFNIPGNPFLFSTTGVGATISANTAVAENFTVPASGWDLDTLTVYAFQTGQTSASVTQIQVNLWNATPFSATSPGAPPVIPQPVLSVPLTLAAGPGTFIAHRQSPTGTSSIRPVFSYTVSLDGLPNAGVLPQGEYWIQWSFLGASSPSANVFTPLVSPRTAAVDLNARLLNSIDGSAAGPRIWFEGREGFVAGQSEGRAYALPFELGGSVIPAPGSLAALALAALGVARRRR